MAKLKAQTLPLKRSGLIPNNEALPVLVYNGVFAGQTEEIERTFQRHQWSNSWTGGVLSYHHYHSNTHEVLGVKSGKADILIGGEEGQKLTIRAGDVLVLPAGTGHKNEAASEDFQVIGAYPNGSSFNMRKSSPEDYKQAEQEIPAVPLPGTDPVYGDSGPLLEVWYS